MDKIKFCDLLDYEQPQKYIVLNDQYTENGKYPVLTAGKSFILGYTNEINEVYNNLPVIIFDDFTCDCKYVDFPFVVKSSAMKMLKSKNDNVNLKYCFYYMNYIDYKISEHKRHWISIYSQLDIKKHDLKTQQKIVEVLDCLSDIIEKKKQQLADLDNLIKSQFIEMFDNKGYEIKQLSDICDKITDGSHNPPQGINYSLYPMLSSQNINESISFDNVRYLTQEDFEKENRRTNVSFGDVLITIVGTIGRSAVVTNEKITLQRSVAVLKPNKQINSFYLNEFIKSRNAQSQLYNKSHGASQKGVYLSDLKTLKVILPPLEMQNKFAELVENIDKSKNDIKQSIEETQNLFNERMQHYFGE